MNLHWITEGSKNKPTRFTKSWVDPWQNEVPPPANPGHNFAGFTKNAWIPVAMITQVGWIWDEGNRMKKNG
jgi:hypothetical protein